MTFQGKTPIELWAEFADAPMNPDTECIETPWYGFPAGTHRECIWHWFEEFFGVSVHDLMFPYKKPDFTDHTGDDYPN